MRILLLVALFGLLIMAVLVQRASAHDVRPAYLQVDQIGEERYSLIWRTPILSGAPLPVILDLPAEAVLRSSPNVQTLPGSQIARHVVDIPGGFGGKRIGFTGLEATITDVLVRVSEGAAEQYTVLVRPSQPWVEFAPHQGALTIAATFLGQGVEHILYGIDHLLFVVSLLLIVRDWRMLVLTISAFTVAHSITLGLATFGLVHPPSGPVETMIAASIVLVAAEAVRRERGVSSATIRWPWVVAFVFGLLHGFGFAGALLDLGLPRGDIPLALLTFNLGVELGQLAFIAFLMFAMAALRRVVSLPPQAIRVSAYAIGITSSFWVFERLQASFA
ncbi:HupE/UreJ family protein [Rhodobacteraceae bacterium NNCM2]|nr:HupE/UreJ family protein [Coraliihabitans acroporae]